MTEQDDLFDVWETLPFPRPRTLRDVFCILSMYDRCGSIEALVDRIDTDGLTASDIYFTFLDRAPENRQVIQRQSPYNARPDIVATLSCAEFQSRAPELFLRAFPEKDRLVFAHMPKCAGTDLQLLLAPKFLSVPELLHLPEWFTSERLVRALGGYTQQIPLHDTIFYYGHIDFERYITNAGTRLRDTYFTVLRDPLDQILSSANYIVKRLATDPERRRPDTARWAAMLGEDTLPKDLQGAGGIAVAERVLYDPSFVGPNPICSHLGGGSAERSLDNLSIYNFEISDTRRYDRWLQERWNIPASPRHNRSFPWLTRENAVAHRQHIARLTAQDQQVYDRVLDVLDRKGTSSIQGRDLL